MGIRQFPSRFYCSDPNEEGEDGPQNTRLRWRPKILCECGDRYRTTRTITIWSTFVAMVLLISLPLANSLYIDKDVLFEIKCPGGTLDVFHNDTRPSDSSSSGGSSPAASPNQAIQRRDDGSPATSASIHRRADTADGIDPAQTSLTITFDTSPDISLTGQALDVLGVSAAELTTAQCANMTEVHKVLTELGASWPWFLLHKGVRFSVTGMSAIVAGTIGVLWITTTSCKRHSHRNKRYVPNKSRFRLIGMFLIRISPIICFSGLLWLQFIMIKAYIIVTQKARTQIANAFASAPADKTRINPAYLGAVIYMMVATILAFFLLLPFALYNVRNWFARCCGDWREMGDSRVVAAVSEKQPQVDKKKIDKPYSQSTDSVDTLPAYDGSSVYNPPPAYDPEDPARRA